MIVYIPEFNPEIVNSPWSFAIVVNSIPVVDTAVIVAGITTIDKDPEIDPLIARKYAAVVATGRSDYPNQINNVLAFPGIFRGLLDAQAKNVTDEVLVAAAKAIAERVSSDQLNASFIVPSVFDPAVAPAVAQAVRATLGK